MSASVVLWRRTCIAAADALTWQDTRLSLTAVENLHADCGIPGAAHFISPVRVISLSLKSRKATWTYSKAQHQTSHNNCWFSWAGGAIWTFSTATTAKDMLLIHQAWCLFVPSKGDDVRTGSSRTQRYKNNTWALKKKQKNPPSDPNSSELVIR